MKMQHDKEEARSLSKIQNKLCNDKENNPKNEIKLPDQSFSLNPF